MVALTIEKPITFAIAVWIQKNCSSGGIMTTSLKKAQVGLIKGIVAPETEGYLDILQLPIEVANRQTTLGQIITNLLSLQATLQSVSTRIEHYRITLKAFLEKEDTKYQATH